MAPEGLYIYINVLFDEEKKFYLSLSRCRVHTKALIVEAGQCYGLEECTKIYFPLVGLKFLHLTVHYYIELETLI